MTTRKILVTGGMGSLGSRVVNRLSEAGEDVRVMSRYRRTNTVQADLLAGGRFEVAVEGVSTIIHCASSSLRKTRQVDVEGTWRLLQAGNRAGVSHVVFISVVGVDRNPYFPYYQHKLDAERVFERSGLPWTTLRATQFHGFVLDLIEVLDRLPLMLAPKSFLLQPIDVGEVADRLVELALGAPAGRVPDVGGPEVSTFAELARRYLKATGRRRRVLEVPLPGKVAQASREGAQLTPEGRCGKVRWEEFLERRLQETSWRYDGEGAFMDSKWEGRPVDRGLLRGGLLFLVTTPLVGGLWALLFPRAFYDDFPPSARRLIPLRPIA